MKKKSIKNEKQFVTFLESQKKGFSKLFLQYVKKKTKSVPDQKNILVKNIFFLNLEIINIDLDMFDFKECKFEHCDITKVHFGHNEFSDCIFNDCDLWETNFFECGLYNTHMNRVFAINCGFYDCEFNGTLFSNSGDLADLAFGNCSFIKTKIKNCNLYGATFTTVRKKQTQILIQDTTIGESFFLNVNLRKTRIRKSNLDQCCFNNCNLSVYTIDESNKIPDNTYSSIDFQTIANSQELKHKVLISYFGITEMKIKEHISAITKKVEFNSVFISYSFFDKKFARRLNDVLQKKNIKTFLWEKDAPGGKRLKKIMREHIKTFDRILFIASKNSIKSEACQFELTEGRQKQNKSWKEILFPIHIDNYLFEVEKDDIRPKKFADEFWENIEELKDVNSLGFCRFNVDKVDVKKFNTEIIKLIESLKSE